MKLQDINPAIWAAKTYYENDGTGGVNPWRNGSTLTKLEPPPGTSAEGWIPNEAVKAEHENYLRNQTTQLEAVLSFDRLGDSRLQWYPSTDAVLNTLPIFDGMRKKNVVCASSSGAQRLWEISDDMRLVIAPRALILGTPGTDYEGVHAIESDSYVLAFTGINSFERYDATSYAGAALTITASHAFRPCRPLALVACTLFSGSTPASKACVIRLVGSVATIVTLPSAPTFSQARFVQVPNGNIYYFVRGDSAYYKSADNGLTWTRAATSRSCFSAVYDANADIWYNSESFFTGTTSTIVYASTSEPGTDSFVRSIPNMAICAVETFGRYAVGLAQRKSTSFAGGTPATYAQVVGSRDSGRSWSVLDTIRSSNVSALSGVATTGVDFSSGAGFGVLTLVANPNGWAVRLSQASYHLQFMRPLAQQDTAF